MASTKALKAIAREYHLASKKASAYLRFIRFRFPNENSVSYLEEWAERFLYKKDWIAADKKSKKILIKIGYRTPSGELR